MNIIVTGASKGIGYETVKAFAAESGNKIVAIARNRKLLESLKSECDSIKGGSDVYVFPFDLENDQIGKSFIQKISENIIKIDILINNAGLLINKPFNETTDEDLDKIFNVNVKRIFSLIRNLLPLFNSDSHIINISSMGGFQGSQKFPGLSAYSSSKGALAVLSECLAVELSEQKIGVNCLALGAVQTEMLGEAFPGYKAPLNAGEMAVFIKDFALKGNKYFNGKIIPVSVSTP